MSSQQSTWVPAHQMISSHDHPRLVNYYADHVQELREKAKQWEFATELYEKHPEPDARADTAQHAPHCWTIAQNYRKAADEADALAQEHRAMRSHGEVQ